jgi:hypothetical protein
MTLTIESAIFCFLLAHFWLLLGLLFDPKAGDSTFLHNVGELLEIARSHIPEDK